MVVNPLWFNINLKTMPTAWHIHICLPVSRMPLSEPPFFYELYWQNTSSSPKRWSLCTKL
jgi:hypothetical protein